DPGSDRLSKVDVDAQTNENDTLNLEKDQWAKKNDGNDFENNEKTNELLPDSQVVGTDDQFSIDNMNQPDNERVNDNRQSINVISGMLEQTTLANNSTQADDIGSIQDNDNDVSNEDSPGWLECEDCYGNKKELCEYCVCSVCKWKGDRGYILLCDGSCGKNFHTRCLNPPVTRIPPGNWYCKECENGNSKKSKRKKIRIEYSSSDEIDNQSAKKIKRLKSKSIKKYKAKQDISDSDDEN
ncbi:15449_t:CDS:2, partial [Racocetra fulgida]